jgi:beta-N-acetylhexosaminidase
LRRPPRLSRALRGVKEPAARRVAAYAIGLTSGRDLARVGVTLNLAPVVDLDHGLRNRKDKHSRIGERAISRDPEDVADVGAGYCAGLATVGVVCTLKHFPGLGRVSADTHVSTARLDTTVDKLAAADWLPFQRVLTRRDVTVMIGHVTLDSLEPGVTASASRVLVSGVLRGAWGFDGLVLSDDLTMTAARRQVGGIGAVAVGALNAGVDVLLVTHATERIYDVLQALLAASDEGALDGATLTRARARIERFLTGPRVADHSLP